jgi:hypothetical protein
VDIGRRASDRSRLRASPNRECPFAVDADGNLVFRLQTHFSETRQFQKAESIVDLLLQGSTGGARLHLPLGVVRLARLRTHVLGQLQIHMWPRSPNMVPPYSVGKLVYGMGQLCQSGQAQFHLVGMHRQSILGSALEDQSSPSFRAKINPRRAPSGRFSGCCYWPLINYLTLIHSHIPSIKWSVYLLIVHEQNYLFDRSVSLRSTQPEFL